MPRVVQDRWLCSPLTHTRVIFNNKGETVSFPSCAIQKRENLEIIFHTRKECLFFQRSGKMRYEYSSIEMTKRRNAFLYPLVAGLINDRPFHREIRSRVNVSISGNFVRWRRNGTKFLNNSQTCFRSPADAAFYD